MQSAEMLKLLEKVADLFGLSAPKEEKVKAWLEIFKSYDYKTLDIALNNYAAKEKYQPKPADLIEAYWEIVHKREGEAVAKAMEGAKDCKYCQGTGWFRTIPKDDPYGGYVCACKCQGDPTNLNLALASKEFKWSDKKRAFVPRDTWIGDDEPGDRGIFDYDDVGRYVNSL